MRPIPINASVGMLLSLAIALIVTPWLSLKLLRRHAPADGAGNPAGGADDHETPLHRWFGKLMQPFLDIKAGSRRRHWLFGGMAALVVLAASLAVVQLVVMKMLPFDNKSEFQVVVDLPEGRTLEDTNALLVELAAVLDAVPEVLDYQGYAGTSAPMNFNGLVRQYFLRSAANAGDLQVNLVDRHERDRQSHEIARALRPQLAAIGEQHGASIKVVEVPPGPPVLSPLVAEVYGPDYARSRELALALAERFRRTEGVVDVDTSVEHAAPRETLVVDRARAARLGVPQSAIAEALQAAVSGIDATYVHDGASKYPRPVRLRLPASGQAGMERLLALQVRGGQGQLVPLSELVSIERGNWDGAIHHKDLLPVVYVTADEAGALDSPLYGMFDLVGQLRRDEVDGRHIAQTFITQPPDTSDFAIKWDGEWQITYETFRDMGIAYAAGMVLIYLLVVAQFRSYLVPLVIMAPIPLTVIGVMPGHALLGAQFTATSMIGMIALAGIIVRNSILLVDFINHALADGRTLEQAVVDACAVRAKPIVLTGAAAMMGAFFILDDPIFNGLAVSLIFGILVSTVLTLVVIPLLYYTLMHRSRTPLAESAEEPA
ncbi:MAG TPA: efflux RND transporter permease subunit, partial [Lysobacter sp.]|nr:efflux RND transporter permease subunit [Lysobacter sp.]